MREDLTVLGLIFEAAGVDASIGSKNDRIVLQKTIYLAQVAGVDLGYRYSWYINGPYSTRLTKDYYALLGSPEEAIDLDQWELGKKTSGKIEKVKELIGSKPEHESLSDWLEVLCSIHYLKVVRSNDDQKMLATLQQEKPHLVDLAQDAREKLTAAGLI